MKFEKLKKKLAPKGEAKVLMIRHGSTDYNSEDKGVDRIRGWINVPLNDQGREDAENTRKQLVNEHPKAMYSSDLSRALETAQIVNKNFNLPIVETSELRPWNLGEYQGKVTKTIVDDMNKMIRDENIIPKNGESFREFRVRFLSRLKKIIELAKAKNETIIVVSHYRNLKTADAWIKNGQKDDLSVDVESLIKDEFKPGEIYEIKCK